ncbi:molybdenum ABC transporter ATP-binding protein [Pseudomonas sp.]|uniref:molybdenum ABC transporter ATP-binding protein n=1 Tax=Pseudomonas sp. TaxID=306 RepID=UPI003D0BB64A
MIWPLRRASAVKVPSDAPQDLIRARFKVARPDFTLDVDLTLPGRGVTALFGHSGSGKTSCLRCFAGLDRPAEGLLQVNGEQWQDSAHGHFLPAHQRPVGYVFQEANLFPHLSVRRNLEYGLKRIPAANRHIELEQAVTLLGIDHLLQRMPANLSGGERQRVAIARALLTSPRLLLMDEPLASLDLKRKQEVLPYLERLHEELDIPVLYVSHAPDEVARLADHLVLLEDGQVRASGPLKETLLRADLPFAFEDDAEAVIDGQVSGFDADYHLLQLTLAGSPAQVRLPHGSLPLGQMVRVKIKARDVSLSVQRAEGSSLLNLLPVEVDSWRHMEAQSLLTLRVGEQRLLARITRYSFDQLGIHAGQALWAQVKSVSLLGA